MYVNKRTFYVGGVIFLIVTSAILAYIRILKTESIARNTVHDTEQQQPAIVVPKEKSIVSATDFYDISAKYPTESLDRDGIMESFVKDQIAQREESWKDGGEAYETEKKIEKDFPDRSKMTYTLDISYQRFVSNVRDTVSYLFIIGEYTGGANGREIVQSFTFDKNGKVDLESLLDIAGSRPIGQNSASVPNDISLSELLLAQAQKNPEQFPDLDMVRTGLGLAYLGTDGVTLDHKKCGCDGFFYGSNLQNFVVTDDGLEFFFGKGDITIGAAGAVSIGISWSDLQPYLKENI